MPKTTKPLASNDFYPRSPRGERLTAARIPPSTATFLSTLPARGATMIQPTRVSAVIFLSTLPARGATAPAAPSPSPSPHFYPRSPRGERPGAGGGGVSAPAFLSTLPARGATVRLPLAGAAGFISTPAPRLGCAVHSVLRSDLGCISIHAPREGSDLAQLVLGAVIRISIHAPREGSDCQESSARHALCDFYPRSPRGERQGSVNSAKAAWDFYPRSPRGERPYDLVTSAWEEGISIHAPREGSDFGRPA